MKSSKLVIVISFCYMFILMNCVLAQTNSFTPLSKNEKLVYSLSKSTNRQKMLKIYTVGIDKKEIFSYLGFNFSFEEHNQSKNNTWLTFNVFVRHGDEHSPTVAEIWFIDGVNGKIKKLYTTDNVMYAVDSEAQTICIYDAFESMDIPIIKVYRISDMKLLNEIKANELKGKATYPKLILYQNDKYIIELVNDGPDYKKIEIPIK